MKVVYVGDARDVIKRILSNHCRGNVEASALRKAVAEAMGYPLMRTRRPSGSTRVRIHLSNPREGEERVSEYIQSGKWRYVTCGSDHEANDFQWFMIEKLKPLLNKTRRPWNDSFQHRYSTLKNMLETSPALGCHQLKKKSSGQGVYVLYHNEIPCARLNK